MTRLQSSLHRLFLVTGAVIATSAATLPSPVNAPVATIVQLGGGVTGDFQIEIASPDQTSGRVVLVPFVGLVPTVEQQDPEESAEHNLTALFPSLDEKNDDAAPGLGDLLTDLGLPAGATSGFQNVPPKIIADALERLSDGNDPKANLTQQSQPVSSMTPVHWVADHPDWNPAQSNGALTWPWLVQGFVAQTPNPDTSIFSSEAMIVASVLHQHATLFPSADPISPELMSALIAAIQDDQIEVRIWMITLYFPIPPVGSGLPDIPALQAPTSTSLSLSKESAVALPPELAQSSSRLDPPSNEEPNTPLAHVDDGDPFFYLTSGGSEITLELADSSLQPVALPVAQPGKIKIAFPLADGSIQMVPVTSIDDDPDYFLNTQRKGAFVTATVPDNYLMFGALSVVQDHESGSGYHLLKFLSKDESTTDFTFFMSIESKDGVLPADPLAWRNGILSIRESLYLLLD